MRKSKADLIAEVVTRELADVINAVFVDHRNDAGASTLLNYKQEIISRLNSRLSCRKYVALEIIDSATWHRRKVGKEEL